MRKRADPYQNETPRQAYYRILEMKKKGEIPDVAIDLCTDRADKKLCLACGSPHMDDCMTPYECRKCGIRRVGQEEYDRYCLTTAKSQRFSKKADYNPDQLTEGRLGQ